VSVHRHTISQAKALGHFLLDTEFCRRESCGGKYP
jgi:hypothetical protein